MEDYIIEIIKQIFGNEMVAPICVCIVAFAVTPKLWKYNLPMYIRNCWLVIPSIGFRIQANGKDGEFFSDYNREKDGYLRFSLIDALEPEIVRAIDRIVRLIDDALPEYMPRGKELNRLVEDSCFDVAVPVDVNGAVF